LGRRRDTFITKVCRLIFLKQDIVFEENAQADVFLFVPTSVMSQGGTPPETTDQDPVIINLKPKKGKKVSQKDKDSIIKNLKPKKGKR